MAMGARHRSCVGDSMETWCPGQRSQIGTAVSPGSQVGWRTRSCREKTVMYSFKKSSVLTEPEMNMTLL